MPDLPPKIIQVALPPGIKGKPNDIVREFAGVEFIQKQPGLFLVPAGVNVANDFRAFAFASEHGGN